MFNNGVTLKKIAEATIMDRAIRVEVSRTMEILVCSFKRMSITFVLAFSMVKAIISEVHFIPGLLH